MNLPEKAPPFYPPLTTEPAAQVVYEESLLHQFYSKPLINEPEDLRDPQFSRVEAMVREDIKSWKTRWKAYFYEQLKAKDYQLELKDSALKQYANEVAYWRNLEACRAKNPSHVTLENTAMSVNQPNSDTFNSNFQGANIGNVANVNRDSASQQAKQYNYQSKSNTSLEVVARDIQSLLLEISPAEYIPKTSDKLAIAAMAIEKIEKNSSLRTRILSACKAGSVDAFEQFLNHPASSFVLAAIKDWQETGHV